MPFIDLHEDVLVAERTGASGTGLQTGFDELAESNVRVVLATGFTDVEDFFDPRAEECFGKDLEDYAARIATDERFSLITTAADIRRMVGADSGCGIVFHIEGLNTVRDHVSMEILLRDLYKKGLRSIGPLWTLNNPFGGGTNGADVGLTPLGAALIDWCESAHVIFDLAHMNPPTFADALAKIRKPPIVSHTACDALVPSVRNITDAQLRIVGDRGGVAGIFLASKFARSGDTYSSANIADHLMHMVDTAGEDHVALGTDLGGITSSLPSDIRVPGDLPNLIRALRERGLSDRIAEKIAFKNAQRVLEAHLE
ncbi:membrane dipeptidase [Candidatus Kaiserbacteria bacterium]|nr:membrane dipeptidase [Candidatus Kaiserbacteria bacterium]